MNSTQKKKALVSGCFDLLHSGHIQFFKEAASYGELYVALGSDQTIFDLKGRPTVTSEEERLFMVKSVAYVKDAFISQGTGILDFDSEIRELQPDYLVVNEDGNLPEKEKLCQELGIEYVILKREPHPGLKARSTTELRKTEQMPYRIDLCGGWLDQPYVSKHYPGCVITISLEPTIEFNERSGMATSTRRKALEIWGNTIPSDNYEKLAKILFAYDNPPGTKEISGSQDAIGLVFPGLARAYYDGEYWPEKIDHLLQEDILSFIENHIYLVPLGPRQAGFSVLENTRINRENARQLADATDRCWEAILKKDVRAFGEGLRDGFDGQVNMFPNMLIPTLEQLINKYKSTVFGWKVSGAGGGGYLILVSGKPVEKAIQIKIRRGY